jgi:Flp pilus assembly protein TadG
MAKAGFAGFLTARLRRFRSDKRGNVAVIFIFALLPILTAIGAVTDYSMASRMRAKMQSAADAAAVAAISQNSAGWIAASTMSGNGSVASGLSDANNLFCGNLNVPNATSGTGCNAPASAGFGNLSMTGTSVTKTGATLSSIVNFSATVPVVFMKVLGYQTISISGTSKATSSLPLYIDFYMTLDVSGSMGLPSTPAEAVRMQSISPDNYVQYPTGCTLACHFAQPPLSQLNTSACIDPSPNTPSGNPTPTQKYPTGNYCLAYDISRISQSAYTQLLANHGGQLPAYKYTKSSTPPAQVAQPAAFYSTSTAFPHDPILTPVSSCPTAGTDACIQLRLDAVGYALTDLFQYASDPQYLLVPSEFRIGLYPFITSLYSYFPLTSAYNGSPTNSSTINYAAAQLATLLDTNTNSNLGSGGTHIDVALHGINTLITSVGSGISASSTLPYVFLITDGAQDPQSKGVPNGGWSGSNHATVLSNSSNSYSTACTTLKNRGIVIAVLYVPYQKIDPVNASFAGDEDDYANNNIPNIPPSLLACASPNFFYTANTPTDIDTMLKKMFQQALSTAHITN